MNRYIHLERIPKANAEDLNERSKEPFITLHIDDPNFDGSEKAKSLIGMIF